MRCLAFGDGGSWCDSDEIRDVTDDPRDATCSNCLNRASSYGAAAAMRYAAVEAGVTHDPELVRERDEALRALNAINQAVTRQGGFFCTLCERIRPRGEVALVVNDVVWCNACAPSKVS